MSKLIVVSNRLPVTVEMESGKFNIKPSVGGLATGISSLNLDIEQTWIGWPGMDFTRSNQKTIAELIKKLNKENLHPVFLSNQEIEDYYYGFCNETIWPLFHYFIQYGIYQKSFWECYKKVNEKFCDAVLEVADKDDIIWIHDYHLMLLPQMVRNKLPKAKIGFFLHIPFPSSEIFRLIPWCKEIIDGLLGADLIGFHTFDYVRHFGESVRRIRGIEHSLGQLTVENRALRIDAFPMGIDYEKFASAPKKSVVKDKVKRIKKRIGGNYKIILSIDRLDYSKGIPHRLEAFDLFLEQNPQYNEKVLLFLVIVPSRTEVEQYKQLKEEVDNLVGKINGKYATLAWEPIRYLYRSFIFDDLVSLYTLGDVLFVTPLRDGMNLIAKEYVASRIKEKGVLILGEMAGTAKELGEAIIINPNNVEESANALKAALEMSESEQSKRMKKMRSRLKRYNIERWIRDYLDRLDQIKSIQYNMISKELTTKNISDLVKRVSKSKKSLLLLDYDGTLMPFDNDPQKVKPDKQLYEILSKLKNNSNTETVIISGRDKETLEKWLGKVTNGLVAEHGVWVKRKKWETIDSMSDKWKTEIKPILEIFVDRTPGSFIEEKNYSLAWHYRKVDPALAAVRVGELKDDLSHITSNLNVGVLEGNKVIEIKSSGVNKGKGASYWLNNQKWDLILSVGDDWTDEDIFEILPRQAISIKVGFGPSKAKFRLPTIPKVRDMLYQITNSFDKE